MKNFLFEIGGEKVIILANNKKDAWLKLTIHFDVVHLSSECYGEITEEEAENMGIDVYD